MHNRNVNKNKSNPKSGLHSITTLEPDSVIKLFPVDISNAIDVMDTIIAQK